MQENAEPSESTEPSESAKPSSGWRWDLDEEDSPVVLEHPPGLEDVANAFEWLFDGLLKDKDLVRGFLPAWHRLLAEHGPDYSLSTNSAGGIRLDTDTVRVSSFFDHFEPIVIPNTLFEEVVAAYQDFAEHDDRFE